MTKHTFGNIEKYFWWLFIWLPLLVGMVRYNWLSIEPYISRPPQSSVTRPASAAPNGNGPNAPVMRQLKGMEVANNKDDFIRGRYLEVVQYGVFSFLYGLLGCFFYSYGQVVKEKAPSFAVAFKKSLIFAILFPIFFVVCTL